MLAETPPRDLPDTFSTQQHHHSCSATTIITITTSFFLRGDPFSPVTHLQFVLGSTRPRYLITATTIYIPRPCPSTRLPSPALDSLLESADFPGFTFLHEFKVMKKIMMAILTSHPLLLPILTVEIFISPNSIPGIRSTIFIH